MLVFAQNVHCFSFWVPWMKLRSNLRQLSYSCSFSNAVSKTLFNQGVNKNTWAVHTIEFRKLNLVLLEGSTKLWKSLTWEENPSNPDVLVFNISPKEKSYAERSCWSFVACIGFQMLAGVLDTPNLQVNDLWTKGQQGEPRRVGSMWKKVAQPSLLPLPQTPSYWANCCSGRLLRQ